MFCAPKLHAPQNGESIHSFFKSHPVLVTSVSHRPGSWNVARAVQAAKHLLVRGSVAAGESVAR